MHLCSFCLYFFEIRYESKMVYCESKLSAIILYCYASITYFSAVQPLTPKATPYTYSDPWTTKDIIFEDVGRTSEL